MNRLYFWDKVDDVLKSRGMLVSDLWKNAGINPHTAKGWRTRNRYPDAEAIRHISQVLNVSIEWLMQEDAPGSGQPARLGFWSRIDSTIKHFNMSLNSLYREADINPFTAAGWRKNNRYPDAESLVKIAKVLDVSVEWLITGEELALGDEYEGKEIKAPSEIISGKGSKVTHTKPEEPSVLVPIYSQKISAGHGIMMGNESEIEGYVRIPTRMARGMDSSRLGAAVVRGDSMIGANIFAGDIVVFASGVIDDGDGLYVVALGDSVLVKRVSFNPIDNTVTISSENPKYEPIKVKADTDNVRLCGKVVGWIHNQPM